MAKRQKKKKSSISHRIVILFLLLAIVVFPYLKQIGVASPISSISQNQQLSVASLSAALTAPTATPSPTLIPTPTPQPLIGYCLRVPVLMYHHIQPMTQASEKGQGGLSVDDGMFDQHLAYITSQGYTTLTAKELVDALKNKTSLPPKSLVLTFDDGYRDNHTYAFPIIKKYGVKANLMLATGLIEGADYLTWDQVSDMKNSGLYYFVDHTWSHFNVGAGTEEKIRDEIETAKKQIEAGTGQTVDIFAYPYGFGGSTALRILQEFGFSGAFSTIPGFYQCDSFIMTLHRIRIGNNALYNYGL